jgi:hypothetical protein
MDQGKNTRETKLIASQVSIFRTAGVVKNEGDYRSSMILSTSSHIEKPLCEKKTRRPCSTDCRAPNLRFYNAGRLLSI